MDDEVERMSVGESLSRSRRLQLTIDDSRVAESFSRSFKRAPCFGMHA